MGLNFLLFAKLFHFFSFRNFVIGFLVIFTTNIPANFALQFDCRFGLQQWPVLGNSYECGVTVVQQGDSSALQSVRGSHTGNRRNSDVVALNLENQILTKIPTNIEIFFPNLKGIRWHLSSLFTLTASDLKPFPGLMVLEMAGNQIQTLDGDLFKHNQLLSWINFENNLIRIVGDGLLDELYYLKFAAFGSNYCINYSATIQSEIPELIKLLSNCRAETTTRVSSVTTTSTFIKPSSTSAPIGECSRDCLVHIEMLGVEITEINSMISKLEIENVKLLNQLLEVAESNAKLEMQNQILLEKFESAERAHEERFVELEMQMREISSSPCSC